MISIDNDRYYRRMCLHQYAKVYDCILHVKRWFRISNIRIRMNQYSKLYIEYRFNLYGSFICIWSKGLQIYVLSSKIDNISVQIIDIELRAYLIGLVSPKVNIFFC